MAHRIQNLDPGVRIDVDGGGIVGAEEAGVNLGTRNATNVDAYTVAKAACTAALRTYVLL